MTSLLVDMNLARTFLAALRRRRRVTVLGMMIVMPLAGALQKELPVLSNAGFDPPGGMWIRQSAYLR
jgi:hypothetical protein